VQDNHIQYTQVMGSAKMAGAMYSSGGWVGRLLEMGYIGNLSCRWSIQKRPDSFRKPTKLQSYRSIVDIVSAASGHRFGVADKWRVSIGDGRRGISTTGCSMNLVALLFLLIIIQVIVTVLRTRSGTQNQTPALPNHDGLVPQPSKISSLLG
jgi:hypothetical protein